MASSVLPTADARFRAVDSNGDPIAGALLYTYEAGTSTPLATYSQEDLDPSSLNTNPVVADAGGLFGPVFALPEAYKLVLKEADGTTVWTQDNIFPPQPASSSNVDLAGTAGEELNAGECCYLSDGSGGNSSGQWYKADADLTYASVLPMVAFAVTALSSGESGLFRTDGKVTGLSALTPGANYYVSATAGAITATKPGNARFVGQAESTTVLVVTTNPPLQSADILEIQCFS